MLWPQHLLLDGQGTLIVGLGPSQVALGLEESAEIVEAVGGIGMLWPQHLLPDGQGTLIVGLGFCKLCTPYVGKTPSVQGEWYLLWQGRHG